MARAGRNIAVGVGAASALGAAIFAANVARKASDEGEPAMPAKDAPAIFEVCLKTDLALVRGADKKCYSAGEAAALLDLAVIDDQGSPVALQLSHPSDETRAPESVTTCNAYGAYVSEGWYAMTAREMAHEAYFVRACGVLHLLATAAPASVSYFENDELSLGDVEALAAGAPFGIGEAAAQAGRAEKLRAHFWRIASGAQVAVLQEIAYADFNGDGRGDMLVFVALGVEGGSAGASLAGLIDKPGPEGPVTFIEWRRPPEP